MEIKKFDELYENNSDGFKLKNAQELKQIIDSDNKKDIFNYIDKIHNELKNYQLVIDMAISKNKNIYS